MDDVKQSVMTQPEKVEYIISGCCAYFGITKEKLLSNPGSRSDIWDKKRILITILDNNTSCNSTEIAEILGYKSRATVLYHRNVLQDELSDAVYGNNKAKFIYNELLSYLNF